MDYQATLEYLYGLTDYEKERIARYDPSTLDLSRVQRLLARLGNPHRRFPSIHIAGTKGKGSVAAMCASVFRSAGLRTGLYTSPHLHTFRERIQVDGQLIPPDTLTALVRQYRSLFEEEPELTTFEAITALAFVYFERCQVDFAVIEVGLGGRLDATNVVTPRASVITSLSYDHTYLLGDTLADIAYEKGGIIKPGIPTVCAPQKAEAQAVIERLCAERGSPLTLVGRDWIWMMEQTSLQAQRFYLSAPSAPSELEGLYALGLLGRHQLNNAAAAVATIDLLRQGGTALQPHHVREGLAQVHWPGRLEILQQGPLLIVDCAHNGDSVAKLMAALDELFGPHQRWTFILGASNDKDLPGMLRALAPRVDRLLVTQARHPRAMLPEEVASVAAEILPGVPIDQVDDVSAALARALERNHAPICVTGSIFVVADAREAWALRTDGALLETDYQPILSNPSAD